MALAVTTYQPIASTDSVSSHSVALAEREHLHLAFGDNGEDVHPGFVLGALACRLPILFTRQHAFLGPRRAVKSEFFIGYADTRLVGSIARIAVGVVLLSFANDSPREVRGETDGWREEC